MAAKTLDWLINDDKLQISPDAPNLLQRYILALLYFTTDGSNWEFSFNWLAPVPECQWREVSDRYEVINGVCECSADEKVTSIRLGKGCPIFSRFLHELSYCSSHDG